MDIAIVICTRRRPAILARCLSAVARLNPSPSQVIVVDNSEGDPATKKLASEFGAHYTLEPNAGLGSARKRGLAECKTRNVVFLEDDTLPESDWLTTALISPARNNSIGPTANVLNFELQRRRNQKRGE